MLDPPKHEPPKQLAFRSRRRRSSSKDSRLASRTDDLRDSVEFPFAGSVRHPTDNAGNGTVEESPMTKLSNEIDSRLAVDSPCALGRNRSKSESLLPRGYRPKSGFRNQGISKSGDFESRGFRPIPVAAPTAVAESAFRAPTPKSRSQWKPLPTPVALGPPQPRPATGTRSGASFASLSAPLVSPAPSQSTPQIQVQDLPEKAADETHFSLQTQSDSMGTSTLSLPCDDDLAELDFGQPNRSLWPTGNDEQSPAASFVESPFEPERSSKKRGLAESPADSRSEKENTEPELATFTMNADSVSHRPEFLLMGPAQLMEPPPLRAAQSPVLPKGGRPVFIDRAEGVSASHDDDVDSASSPTARLAASLDDVFAKTHSNRPVPQFSKSETFATLTKINEQAQAESSQRLSSGGKRFCMRTVTAPAVLFKSHENIASSACRGASQPPRPELTRSAPSMLPGMSPIKKALPVEPGERECDTISPNTLTRLMRGEFGLEYSIIDCRFPYEFEGGHIKGAQNFVTPFELERTFFHNGEPIPQSERTVLIFHCEYSSRRAPKLYKHLRALDRKLNQDHYPRLHYPEIYVLDKGYKSFVRTHDECCLEGRTAGSKYVGMCDEQYAEELKDAEKSYKAVWREAGRRGKNRRRTSEGGSRMSMGGRMTSLSRCISSSLP